LTTAFDLLTVLLYTGVGTVMGASILLSLKVQRSIDEGRSLVTATHLKTSFRELLLALVFLGITVALMILHELLQMGFLDSGDPTFVRALSVVALVFSMSFFVSMSFHAREGEL